MDVAVFDLERRHLRGLQTTELGEVGFPVLRMDERSEFDLAEFLLTVAEQSAICGVALLESPVPVRDGDGRGCVLEDLAEAFFAFAHCCRRCLRWIGSTDPLSGRRGLPRILRRSFLRGHRRPSLL